VAAPPPFIACARKQALIQAFLRAASDYHRMRNAQLAALRNHEGFPFEDEIAAAAAKRERAKAAFLAHSQEHGC